MCSEWSPRASPTGWRNETPAAQRDHALEQFQADSPFAATVKTERMRGRRYLV
jgi:hypothetical protein